MPGCAIEATLQVAPGHELIQVMLAPLGGPAWLPGAHGDEHVMDTQLRGVLSTLTLVEHTQEQAVLLGTFSRQIPRLGHSTRSQLLRQVSTRHQLGGPYSGTAARGGAS